MKKLNKSSALTIKDIDFSTTFDNVLDIKIKNDKTNHVRHSPRKKKCPDSRRASIKGRKKKESVFINDNMSSNTTQITNPKKLIKEAMHRLEKIEGFLQSRYGSNWTNSTLKEGACEYLKECRSNHEIRKISRLLSPT